MVVGKFYRKPACSPSKEAQLCASLNGKLKALNSNSTISKIESELCFYVELENNLSFTDLTEKR